MVDRYMQQRGKRHTLAMASPEEAQGLQQPTRMRKSGLYSVQRPSGTIPECNLISCCIIVVDVVGHFPHFLNVLFSGFFFVSLGWKLSPVVFYY